MSGFITMQREALDHPLLKDAERFRAWFWLIANACWKPTKNRIKGQAIELQRGQLSFSQRFLAEKWGWSKSRVDRFIADLRDEGMIETCSKNGATSSHAAGQGQSILTICNYAKYQDVQSNARGNDDPNSGATAGQQRGNSGAKKNKGNHVTSIPSPYGDGASDPDDDGDDAPEEAPPIDFAKVAIDSAIAILTASGRSEAQARRLIGKWRQTFTDGQLIDAVARARERSVADPAAFLAQQLHHDTPRRQNHGKPARNHHDDDEPRNPFVRAALERQAERAAEQRG